MEDTKLHRLNEPVLVLNGNFEPLNVCSTRRALSLLVLGKARVVENGRGEVRAVSGLYPRPSVIRLSYVIRRPRARVRLNNREVFRRDDFRCVYCGQRSTQRDARWAFRVTIHRVSPQCRMQSLPALEDVEALGQPKRY